LQLILTIQRAEVLSAASRRVNFDGRQSQPIS
jgi:hypothetical protein